MFMFDKNKTIDFKQYLLLLGMLLDSKRIFSEADFRLGSIVIKHKLTFNYIVQFPCIQVNCIVQSVMFLVFIVDYKNIAVE